MKHRSELYPLLNDIFSEIEVNFNPKDYDRLTDEEFRIVVSTYLNVYFDDLQARMSRHVFDNVVNNFLHYVKVKNV